VEQTRAAGAAQKQMNKIVTLVERAREGAQFHVADVTGENLKGVRSSRLPPLQLVKGEQPCLRPRRALPWRVRCLDPPGKRPTYRRINAARSLLRLKVPALLKQLYEAPPQLKKRGFRRWAIRKYVRETL